MKYLITGGSGFIGSNVIEWLQENGSDILNLDVNPPNVESHNQYWKQCDILESVNLDMAFRRFKPTYVLHLAARTDTLADSLNEYKCNTVGTDNVLSAIKNTDSIQRVIITSSQFVNQYHGVPKDDLCFAPYTAYGESKVMAERATRAANLNCIWTIIRPTNIWGPWHVRYPKEFWRVLGKGMYIHPGGAPVTRCYGYVKNVAYQIDKIFEAVPERVRGKVFYVGDMPIDLLNWVNEFSLHQTGKKVKVVPRNFVRLLAIIGDVLAMADVEFPITSSRYRSMTTSNDAPMRDVLEEFGQPPYSLEDGIRETVDWLKIHHPDLVTLKQKY